MPLLYFSLIGRTREVGFSWLHGEAQIGTWLKSLIDVYFKGRNEYRFRYENMEFIQTWVD